MERMRCRVDHLWFEHSDVGLRRQLTPVGGIESVVVDPGAGAVTIEFDASRLDPVGIRRLISSCGYECAPLDDTRADAAGSNTGATRGIEPPGGDPNE